MVLFHTPITNKYSIQTRAKAEELHQEYKQAKYKMRIKKSVRKDDDSASEEEECIDNDTPIPQSRAVK